MKRKYVIHDEDGSRYEVTETEETPVVENVEKIEEVKNDEPQLSSDEITALKKLAALSDKLAKLVSDKVTDENEETDEDEETDKDEMTEKKEEVIDTESSCRDSKYSFNSIEKKKIKTDDSIDPDEEINSAWSKRFNGGK